VQGSQRGNDFLIFYKKCLLVNKNISKDIFKNIVSAYKRAANILEHELKLKNENLLGQPQSYLFKKEEEKSLFDKTNEIRKYFSNVKMQESYEETLELLSGAKQITDNFFDNVIVNDENSDIKKNRLELLQMFCKTCNNFIDFSKLEGA
jgi:glycyl-tRNA synthetase beta chain